MKNKKLIYIAHPFGGEPTNTEACEDLVRMLTANFGESYIFVSPVLNFGHMYEHVGYVNGLDTCLDLLNICDGLFLATGWEKSRGCMAEYGFAKGREMKIFTIKDFDHG